MATRVVEIDDTLYDIVSDCQDELKDRVIEYLNENPDLDEAPCLYNDIDYNGTFHELVDGSVPIYYKEIADTWYLHANELEEAYENAGIGEDCRENNGMVAIYCYIEQEVAEWYCENKDDIYEEWKEAREAVTA